MPENLLVITTLPDLDSAEALAATLVEAGLAACVNIGAAVTSVYRWHGRLERGREVMLTIKTTRAAYPALERAIVDGQHRCPQLLMCFVIGRGKGAHDLFCHWAIDQ